MPRVPYNPVPDVAVQPIAQPRVSEQTPLAAFGGATGEAMSSLGQTMEGAGNELFARAVALKQLDNEAEATKADADYLMQSGQIYNQFKSLEGKAAVDAYPKYQQDLNDLRTKTRDALSNPMSQRMFDARSLSTMGRTIIYGGAHAAEENKRYLVGTSKARIQAAGDQALAAPADEQSFQQQLAVTRDQVQHQGDIGGWSPDQVAQETSKQTSLLWSKRIEGLARTQPFLADKMLKQALADGSIRGEVQEPLINFVRTQTRTVGARNISHDVNSGADLWWGSKELPIQQAKDAIGGFESGNNYDKIGPQTRHGRALGKYQVMEEFLPDYLARAGLPSMSADEFLKNHDAQETVFERTFGADMKKYGSFNEAASRWLTGRGVAEAAASGVKDAFGTDVGAYLKATNGILAKNSALSDRVNRATDLARGLAPDDSLMEDYARQRVETDYAQQHRIKLQDDFNNRQVIEAGLMGGKDGKLPSNLDELKASVPGADVAWSHLDPGVQRRYLKVLATNAKGDVAWTNDGLQRYQYLKGMAQSDPAEFLTHSVIDETKLPFSARRELINLQGRLRANSESDPRVTKALQTLAPDLNAAGISKADKDRFYQFTGALQDALQSWQEENKKQPKAEDVQAIGRRLLAEQAVGMFSREYDPTGYGSKSMFEITVPSDEAAKIKAKPEWQQLGIIPTDQQVQRIYTQKLYRKLYGGTVEKSEAGTEPQVPRSQ